MCRTATASLSSLLVMTAAVAAAGFPQFEEVVIDPHAGNIVYAVVPADVDGDGKPDVVVVTEDRVLWYKAPTWEKGVILDKATVRDNVCIAPHDIDGDGRIDFALGAGWPSSGGTIQWISRGAEGETWTVYPIAEIPSTHRMRWGDVLGTGTPQLTVSPLNGADGKGAPLTAFEIPKNPRTERWPATVLKDAFHRMHNHWHLAVPNADGPAATLTASEEGVNAVFAAPQVPLSARAFVSHPVVSGATGAAAANGGAGEVKTGTGKGGKRILATIEPMHGTHAVVYLGDPPHLTRYVLDDTLKRGHALWLADLDGDGNDEVVVGHSEPGTGPIKGPGVYAYRADDKTDMAWTKHVLDDGGMACEDLFALDLTGDGRPDVLAGGRDTHNVKLYVNQGDAKE